MNEIAKRGMGVEVENSGNREIVVWDIALGLEKRLNSGEDSVTDEDTVHSIYR